MGLFSGLKKMAGKILSKVGELFDSEKIARVGAKLENRANSTAAVIGVSASYNPSKSTTNEVDRVNSALTEFVFDQKENLKDIELALVRVLNDFASDVKDILDDATLSAQFERRCEELRKDTSNNISRSISNRMSISDKECREIMRMKPSKKKQEAMRRFAEAVQKNAFRKAKIDLEISMQDLNNRLIQEYNSSYQEKSSLYNHMIRTIGDYQGDISKQQKLVDNIDEILSKANMVISLISRDNSFGNRKDE